MESSGLTLIRSEACLADGSSRLTSHIEELQEERKTLAKESNEQAKPIRKPLTIIRT